MGLFGKRDDGNRSGGHPGTGGDGGRGAADGAAGTFDTGRGTEIFDKMLLARRVRMVVLAAFVVFVAWQQMWLLTAIGVGLMLLTLWQNKRLKEEIAVRLADDEAARRGGA
ncbi:hypothetical protein [Corynebacterium sp. 335C]